MMNLGSGLYLKSSISKYGKENHSREILFYCDNRDELKIKEKKIVCEEEINKGKCMNLIVGGEGGSTRKGKKHTEKTKEKIRNSLLGRKHSEETKQKIGESSKGRNLGKKLSDET